jgi:hypothetical protein
MKIIDFSRNKLTGFLLILLLIMLFLLSDVTFASAETNKAINDAAMRLVKFCTDPKAGLDERAVATLVDYVLNSKKQKEHALPESQGCPGAYQEFDTKISFSRFMDYSYNALIPATVTRPSALRYSIWTDSQGKNQKLPAKWQFLPPNGAPVVIHGVRRDSNTPDLTTGVYYEYDLKKTLIMTNYKGRKVFISISKQINKSSVGKKGYILGNDSDWNYYYSKETGSAKAGLGRTGFF